ncbi:UxaA family hydrolase [PVC group bacterium]|nr:UxaA family hydrolase [PVC group bacterium]
MPKRSLAGYPRPDGRVGFRNYLLVLPSCVCSAHAAALVGQNVPEAVTIAHSHGCSQIPSDADFTAEQLIGCATNPNVAAVIVVGLGCEQVPSERLADGIAAAGVPVKRVVIQDEGGTKKAVAKATRLAKKMLGKIAKIEREPVGFESLIFATECGGSDAFSGIAANPAVGAASDMMVEAGGTVILSETTEMIGAEHVLRERGVTPQVSGEVVAMVKRCEDLMEQLGTHTIGGNPSWGNLKGGISTLEEKSLGCIFKAGRAPIQEVIEFGDKPTKRGLVVMDTPGNDVESCTGMAAGGAQVCAFTTGRGSPTGCAMMPVIKVASNTPMFEHLKPNMDVNAGTIGEGKEAIEEVGERIFRTIVKVVNGKMTKAEKLGHREFALHRRSWTF